MAVARRQCLYCGAEVGGAGATDRRAHPRKEDEPRPPGLPGTALAERVLVVVRLDGADPERLAAAFGISPYEAKQWARRGGYHLRRAAAPADAAADGERLAAEGIAAFTLDEAGVREAAEPEEALGGRLEGERMQLRTAAGPVEAAADDLVLVVKGPITRELPPMDSRKWTRTASLEPGLRVHLHRLASPRPIEIDRAAFDFGKERAAESSSLEIAGWIAALGGKVPVDDEFRRASPALSPAAPPSGPGARLEDALRSAPRVAAILDNVAQFRFYSAWRGAVERRVRGR